MKWKKFLSILFLFIVIRRFRLIFVPIMSSYCDAFQSNTLNLVDSRQITGNYFNSKLSKIMHCYRR